jgi:hypothetical protein
LHKDQWVFSFLFVQFGGRPGKNKTLISGFFFSTLGFFILAFKLLLGGICENSTRPRGRPYHSQGIFPQIVLIGQSLQLC